MRKRRTTVNSSTVKETIQKAAEKGTSDLKEFMNQPVVKEAAGKVTEVVDKAETVVKEVAKTASTRIGTIHLEIFETNVSMDDVKKAVKKEAADRGLTGSIEIYLNAEERAAYYTVDGKGSAEYRIDLKTL